MRKIKFQGKDFVLLHDNEGAITTLELYSNWECSYAHLFANGEIKRFNKVIGHREDIEFGELVDPVEEEKAARAGAESFLFRPMRFLETMNGDDQ